MIAGAKTETMIKGTTHDFEFHWHALTRPGSRRIRRIPFVRRVCDATFDTNASPELRSAQVSRPLQSSKSIANGVTEAGIKKIRGRGREKKKNNTKTDGKEEDTKEDREREDEVREKEKVERHEEKEKEDEDEAEKEVEVEQAKEKRRRGRQQKNPEHQHPHY